MGHSERIRLHKRQCINPKKNDSGNVVEPSLDLAQIN